jgi:diguanylate cyclase (GGDEF)-like protein
MGNHNPATFDGLQEAIIDLLAQEGTSIREIAERIAAYKDKFPPDQFEFLKAEIGYINESRKNIDTRVRELFKKAVVDRTGLHTRLYLDERVTICEHAQELAYVMCDIDKFHDYNETYGHLQGDAALNGIANQFKDSLSKSKPPDEIIFAARYGGEEFCALLINYAGGKSDLRQRLEQTRTSIETYEIPLEVPAQFDEGYKHRTITIAGGIRNPNELVLSLVKRVDDTLKDAKKTNRRNTSIVA